MGREIFYFATPIDLEQFYIEMLSNNIFAVDHFGNRLEIEYFNYLVKSEFEGNHVEPIFCYLTKKDLDIFYFPDDDKHIAPGISDVVDFQVCKPLPKKIVSMPWLTEKFEKGSCGTIEDTEEYYRQIDEALTHPKFIENPYYIENGFDPGRLWFAPDYYNSKWKQVHKTKGLKRLYLPIERYIIKNFRLAKDNFGYIGPNAYQMYLNGDFVPCSGKCRIEF